MGKASWEMGWKERDETGRQVDADVDRQRAPAVDSLTHTAVSGWKSTTDTHVNSSHLCIAFSFKYLSLSSSLPCFCHLVYPVSACSYSITVMFTKKGHVDLKKSSAKFLDSKRESPKRLRDLRTVLGQCSLLLISPAPSPPPTVLFLPTVLSYRILSSLPHVPLSHADYHVSLCCRKHGTTRNPEII